MGICRRVEGNVQDGGRSRVKTRVCRAGMCEVVWEGCAVKRSWQTHMWASVNWRVAQLAREVGRYTSRAFRVVVHSFSCGVCPRLENAGQSCAGGGVSPGVFLVGRWNTGRLELYCSQAFAMGMRQQNEVCESGATSRRGVGVRRASIRTGAGRWESVGWDGAGQKSSSLAHSYAMMAR